VQLGQPVEQLATALAADARRVVQIKHRVLTAAKLHALMNAGKKTVAPKARIKRLVDAIFGNENDKCGKILVRTADGAYHAYGQKCTHLSCPVYYAREHQRLECPCHEGAFDAATGNVLYGPPPRPLDAIEVEMRDGQVWATGRNPSTREEEGRG